MLEYLTEFVTSNLFAVLGVAGVGFGGLLTWILKKYIDKEALGTKLDDWMRKAGNPKDPARIFKIIFYAGKVVTGWFCNLPFVGGFWNNIIEPYFILFVDLALKVGVWFIMTGIGFFKNGLMSDNTNYANQSKTEASKANKAWK